MKKSRIVFISFIILLLSILLSGCRPTTEITLEAEKLNVYYDLLIQIEEDDKNYVHYQHNLPSDLSLIDRTAEIIKYDEDGFKSLTFHYEGAITYTMYSEESTMFFAPYNRHSTAEKLTEFVKEYPQIKIAVFDKEGSILQVSNSVHLLSDSKFAYSTKILYDIKNNTLSAEFDESTMNSLTFLGREPIELGLDISFFGAALLLFMLVHLFYLCFTSKEPRRWHVILSWLSVAFSILLLGYHLVLNLPYFSISFIPNYHIGEIIGTILLFISLFNLYVYRKKNIREKI